MVQATTDYKQFNHINSTRYFAQPYNVTGEGFFFSTLEEYLEKLEANKDEEFELQLASKGADCGINEELFSAANIDMTNIEHYFDVINEWDYENLVKLVLLCSDQGHTFNDFIEEDDVTIQDVQLYEGETYRSLAEQFIDEGFVDGVAYLYRAG